MGCCGQPLTTGLAITRREIDQGLRCELEYTGGRTVTVTGPVTGAAYRFSGLHRAVAVDPRDAPAILQHGHFRLKRLLRNQVSV
jgi:hypothetical protein